MTRRALGVFVSASWFLLGGCYDLGSLSSRLQPDPGEVDAAADANRLLGADVATTDGGATLPPDARDDTFPLDAGGARVGHVARSVAAGETHTCAVTVSGAVQCWGSNTYGQLGDGTITSKSRPVSVAALTSGVTAIAAGNFHTCALASDGSIRCWGQNTSGKLGDGSTATRNEPVLVTATAFPGGASAISAGSHHTCAVTAARGVVCWGDNRYGQLGNGTMTNSSTAVSVVGLAGEVTSVSAGDFHTCAVSSAGETWCWGYNAFGQVGDGTTTNRDVPTRVVGHLTGIADVTAGYYHTCAITTGGDAQCWGQNGFGQVGNGKTANQTTPAPVALQGNERRVVALASGGAHTCAVTSMGMQCWGENRNGQLGNDTPGQSAVPVAVATATPAGASGISAGRLHSCAVTIAGEILCWGSNEAGRLGNGGATQSNVPVSVHGFRQAGP